MSDTIRRLIEDSRTARRIIENVSLRQLVEDYAWPMEQVDRYAYRGHCTFCEDENAFRVYERAGRFFCTLCRERGDVFTYVMAMERCSLEDCFAILTRRLEMLN